MDKLTSSKLELALVTPDAIEVWNKIVTEFELFFTLDYTTHSPILYVGTKDEIAEPWLMILTRKLQILKLPIRNAKVFEALRQLEDQMKELGLNVTIRYEQDKQKKKSVSLRMTSLTGGAMTTVLDRVPKGIKRNYVQFALNDRWK